MKTFTLALAVAALTLPAAEVAAQDQRIQCPTVSASFDTVVSDKSWLPLTSSAAEFTKAAMVDGGGGKRDLFCHYRHSRFGEFVVRKPAPANLDCRAEGRGFHCGLAATLMPRMPMEMPRFRPQ